MTALFILFPLVVLALMIAVVVLLLKLAAKPTFSAEMLPPMVSPEALAEVERRLSAQVTSQLAALELKESERAKAQRDELGSSLRTRFAENAQLLDRHLTEVRTQMEALGKMDASFQQLSVGVQRFNTLLANVRARGTWGEIQLDKLLDDLLVPGQFARNVKPIPRSNKIVEFALALPGQEEGKPVWLPVDSKFPVEDYERLLAATDEATAERARRALAERIKLFATQVKEYVAPPHTTDFAVLFLPTEGLYIEATRDVSVMEDLRTKHILLTGPQSLAALLSALQFGFRTLAVQKQSAKAWDLLIKTKRQTELFLAQCDKVDAQLDNAHKAVDEARKRVDAIDRQLRTITLPEDVETPDHA